MACTSDERRSCVPPGGGMASSRDLLTSPSAASCAPPPPPPPMESPTRHRTSRRQMRSRRQSAPATLHIEPLQFPLDWTTPSHPGRLAPPSFAASDASLGSPTTDEDEDDARSRGSLSPVSPAVHRRVPSSTPARLLASPHLGDDDEFSALQPLPALPRRMQRNHRTQDQRLPALPLPCSTNPLRAPGNESPGTWNTAPFGATAALDMKSASTSRISGTTRTASSPFGGGAPDEHDSDNNSSPPNVHLSSSSSRAALSSSLPLPRSASFSSSPSSSTWTQAANAPATIIPPVPTAGGSAFLFSPLGSPLGSARRRSMTASPLTGFATHTSVVPCPFPTPRGSPSHVSSGTIPVPPANTSPPTSARLHPFRALYQRLSASSSPRNSEPPSPHARDEHVQRQESIRFWCASFPPTDPVVPLRLLGDGAAARVVETRVGHHVVAAKVYRAQWNGNTPETRDEWEHYRRTSAIACLLPVHANVVTHYAMRTTAGGRLAVLCELGAFSLRRLLAVLPSQDRLPADVLRLWEQIVSGISHLHRLPQTVRTPRGDAIHGLWHCDLKSDNIVCTCPLSSVALPPSCSLDAWMETATPSPADEVSRHAATAAAADPVLTAEYVAQHWSVLRTLVQCKVTDLDEMLPDPPPPPSSSSSSVVESATGGESDRASVVDGGGRGTLHFQAPEALSGRPNERSDVWSLGMVLFELMTGGQTPYLLDGYHHAFALRRAIEQGIAPQWPAGTGWKEPPWSPLYELFAACTCPRPAERPSLSQLTERIHAAQWSLQSALSSVTS